MSPELEQAFTEGISHGREEAARILEAMRYEPPWKDNIAARGVIMIGAKAIRRGRHLTPQEQLLNLAQYVDDGTKEGDAVAAWLRQAAGAGKA